MKLNSFSGEGVIIQRKHESSVAKEALMESAKMAVDDSTVENDKAVS